MKEMTVGERIQQLRKAAGLSQEQLAEQLDVSRQSVSKWELNDAAPEISKIIALSELFGISTDELLKGAESIPAAAGEKESIAAIARLNAAEKRIRTGFITAVAGLIMLALELLLLPVMQVMEKSAFGHFLTNAMDYAGKMPMKAVIFITAAAIAAGGIFMYQGYLCKKKQ
ncbi:MAG: helix-turn-helix domain-containing protein [Christensenellales bacterium]